MQFGLWSQDSALARPLLRWFSAQCNEGPALQFKHAMKRQQQQQQQQQPGLNIERDKLQYKRLLFKGRNGRTCLSLQHPPANCTHHAMMIIFGLLLQSRQRQDRVAFGMRLPTSLYSHYGLNCLIISYHLILCRMSINTTMQECQR